MGKKGVLGIDIGASKVEYTATGMPTKKDVTRVEIGREADASELISIIRTGMREHSPRAIGLSLPGFVVGGRLTACPNLPNVDCKKFMASLPKINARFFLENDLKCMALAEMYAGGMKRDDNFLLVAPGSGIGGAYVSGGRIARGARNMAGEVGHFPMRDELGRWTEWERLCGGRGIERKWREKNGATKSAKEIYFMRDAFAKKIFKESAAEFGAGLAGIAAVLDPAEIIVAGSVGKTYLLDKNLRAAMRAEFEARAMEPMRMIPIRSSKLGYPALRGAWLLAGKKKV